MQQDFAATAERHAGRRADDRERRVLERLEDLLAAGDELLDLTPGCDVGGEDGEPEVGADREIPALVVDDERPVFFVDEGDGFPEKRDDLIVERVALARELEAQHAVADIPDRGRAVLQHRLRRALDVREHQHAFRPLQVVIGAVGAEVLAAAGFETVKGFSLGREQQRRNRNAALREPVHEPIGRRAYR